MLCPAKRMSPLSGADDSRDQVEERRLPGAVRADHADDLALVDVQVEVRDASEPAERLVHLPQLEQPGHDDLHPRSAEKSLGPDVHERDEQRPEQDQPGRTDRLLDEQVLPDEGREIQRRYEDCEASGSLQARDEEDRGDQRSRRRSSRSVPVGSAGAPTTRSAPFRQPLLLGMACREPRPGGVRDRVQDESESDDDREEERRISARGGAW